MRKLSFLLWLVSSAVSVDVCSNVKNLVFQINEIAGLPHYMSENVYFYRLECQNSVLLSKAINYNKFFTNLTIKEHISTDKYKERYLKGYCQTDGVFGLTRLEKLGIKYMQVIILNKNAQVVYSFTINSWECG